MNALNADDFASFSSLVLITCHSQWSWLIVWCYSRSRVCGMHEPFGRCGGLYCHMLRYRLFAWRIRSWWWLTAAYERWVWEKEPSCTSTHWAMRKGLFRALMSWFWLVLCVVDFDTNKLWVTTSPADFDCCLVTVSSGDRRILIMGRNWPQCVRFERGNILRILDSKNHQDQDVISSAPSFDQYLSRFASEVCSGLYKPHELGLIRFSVEAIWSCAKWTARARCRLCA